MARIYYNEEKIYGNPIETAVINVRNFQILIENKNRVPRSRFELEKTSNNFRFFQISNDGIYYDTTEGSFYLPKALIFWDIDDNVFPSEFYFISLINNQLETRFVKSEKEIKWFDIPELHKGINDPKIIEKMELTFEAILAYFNKYKYVEPIKKKIQGITINKNHVEDFLQLLNAKKDFSNEIVEMAYSPTDYFEKNKTKLKEYQILDASKNMYLLYIVNILEEQNIIKTVDWKEEFDSIIHCLNELTGINIENVNSKKYKNKTAGEILSELSEQVKDKIDKIIFCIDTDSDSYSFGVMEEKLLLKFMKIGKKMNIKIYKPKQ